MHFEPKRNQSMSVRDQAKAIADKCQDAYSFARYSSWPAVAAMLLRRGYNAYETEEIMRSKLTRWAADMANKRYGRATSRDLAKFLDKETGAIPGLMEELRMNNRERLAPERQ